MFLSHLMMELEGLILVDGELIILWLNFFSTENLNGLFKCWNVIVFVSDVKFNCLFPLFNSHFTILLLLCRVNEDSDTNEMAVIQ